MPSRPWPERRRPWPFFLHKLLVASERCKEDKRLKDYRQVEAVAKAILTNPAMVEDVKPTADGLHK